MKTRRGQVAETRNGSFGLAYTWDTEEKSPKGIQPLGHTHSDETTKVSERCAATRVAMSLLAATQMAMTRGEHF